MKDLNPGDDCAAVRATDPIVRSGELDGADLDGIGPDELVERLCNDQVMRWRGGQRVPVEAYLARHPRLRGESEATFELIYGEFLLREQQEDALAPEEFYWRFPHFADRLFRQLQLHGARNSETCFADDLTDRARDGGKLESASVSAVRSVAPGYKVLGELGRGGMGAVYKAR